MPGAADAAGDSARRPEASAVNRDDDFPDARRTLHEGGAGLVYLVSRSAQQAVMTGYASHWEIALPLAGVFTWKVGRSVATIDPNCALFISAGQTFSESPPIKRGHSAIVVAPAASVLDQLCDGRPPVHNPHFQARTRLAPPRAQMLAHQLCRLGAAEGSLKGEELTINFLKEVLRNGRPNQIEAPRNIVAKAKELLYERPDERLSLVDAARALGVTPIYLTEAFKKSEGIPLYKYELRLRLANALNRLPECESITRLAFELGFSSHSHFSKVFAATYGLTPSAFRAGARTH